MECRYRYVPIAAALIAGLFVPVLTARPGAQGAAFGADGGSGFDLTISDAPPATLDAPRHHARYLVKPNPIQITNGLALDGRGSLYNECRGSI